MNTDRRSFLKSGMTLAVGTAAARVHGASVSLAAEVDPLLRKAVDAGDVPGVIAVAATRDGLIYEGAFGKRILGQDSAMTLDTVVWIASMTKALTGTAAMQLVEQGKLSLDEPASRVIPELGKVQVLDGWDGDAPRLRAPKRPVTLRHLLTHTAGFSYDLWNTDIGRYMKVKDVPPVLTCQNAALTTPLVADPGDRWEYGINIDYAGKMVEAVSGKRLGTYLKDHLFMPLGMNDSAFRITPEMRPRLARIHQRGDDGKLAPIELEVPQDPEFEMGGGGLYSTAGDYLKFTRMILDQGKGNGNQVLKPETVALMSKNAMGATRVRMLKTAIPTATLDAEFFPGMPKGWGLSFMINDERAPTGRSAGSLAWAGLANTYYWIDPTRNVCGVYLTQILPFADTKALPLFYGFEQSVYKSMGGSA